MDETRIKRVRLRAWRRGFREADLVLGPFADAYASSLTPEELDQFEALLDQPDTDVFNWIIGTEPAPAQFDHAVMARLRRFRPV